MWLVLTAVLLLLDQLTKHAVVANMYLGQSIDLLPVFNFTYVHNYGAAFSFLGDAGGWQRWFLSAIAIVFSVVLLVWLMRIEKGQKVLACAYALVLAGALGNLYDRLSYGYVVDFLHVYYNDWHFPAFNVADIAISLGAMLLIYDAITAPSTKAENHD